MRVIRLAGVRDDSQRPVVEVKHAMLVRMAAVILERHVLLDADAACEIVAAVPVEFLHFPVELILRDRAVEPCGEIAALHRLHIVLHHELAEGLFYFRQIYRRSLRICEDARRVALCLRIDIR